MSSRFKTLLKLDKVNKNSSMGQSFHRELQTSQHKERRIEDGRDRRCCDLSDRGCTEKGISRRVFGTSATTRVTKTEQPARLASRSFSFSFSCFARGLTKLYRAGFANLPVLQATYNYG